MTAPISVEQLFPGIDLTGLNPEDVARIPDAHNRLQKGREAQRAHLKAQSQSLDEAAGILEHMPTEALATVVASVRDPVVRTMLENEAMASAGLVTKYDREGLSTTMPMRPAVREFLARVDRKLSADQGPTRPNRHRSERFRTDAPDVFPVFDRVLQAFLGADAPQPEAGKSVLEAVLAVPSGDGWHAAVTQARQTISRVLVPLADGLEAGLKARKALETGQIDEADPGFDRAFESHFMGAYVTSAASYGAFGALENEDPLDTAQHYAGSPESEAARLMGKSQALVDQAAQIPDATVQDAADAIKAQVAKAAQVVQMPELQSARDQRRAEPAAETFGNRLRRAFGRG